MKLNFCEYNVFCVYIQPFYDVYTEHNAYSRMTVKQNIKLNDIFHFSCNWTGTTVSMDFDFVQYTSFLNASSSVGAAADASACQCFWWRLVVHFMRNRQKNIKKKQKQRNK